MRASWHPRLWPQLQRMAKYAVAKYWSGSIAIANPGLDGKAIMGRLWEPRHKFQLYEQLIGMLNYGDGNVCGLCLGEVGSMVHPLTQEVRERVKNLIEEAFQNSRAGVHGRCQIVWPQGEHPGETLTAWRGDIRIEVLRQLVPLPLLAPYRVVERLLVLHNGDALLVYNNHQPCSDARPFSRQARVEFLKSVLDDMVQQSSADGRIVATMFCGESNCNLQHWLSAVWMHRTWEEHFRRPGFLFANEAAAQNAALRKNGDITTVFAVNDANFEAVQEDCRVENRERQHDVTVASWVYTSPTEKRELDDGDRGDEQGTSTIAEEGEAETEEGQGKERTRVLQQGVLVDLARAHLANELRNVFHGSVRAARTPEGLRCRTEADQQQAVAEAAFCDQVASLLQHQVPEAYIRNLLEKDPVFSTSEKAIYKEWVEVAFMRPGCLLRGFLVRS